LNPPVNHQNDHVWSAGKKRNVDERRLVHERAKFAKHVIIIIIIIIIIQEKINVAFSPK